MTHLATPSNDSSTLAAMLGLSKDKSLLSRGLAAVTLAQTTWHLGQSSYNKWRDLTRHTITVQSDDPIYRDVQEWLAAEADNVKNRRSLLIRSGLNTDNDLMYSDDPEPNNKPARIRLEYNDERPLNIVLNGHKVLVIVERAEDYSVNNGRIKVTPDEIKFITRSRAAHEAVVEHLQQITTTHRPSRRPALFMLDRWGHWERRSDMPSRTLETVVLEDGQAERLVTDIEGFLAAEDSYNRLGAPWHRGYLFYGPPGTGKTSTVRALASHFGLDLWYAPLGDIDKDSSLMGLVAKVRSRSILLLEDIDVYHAATSREDVAEQASLSGLLNALDGVATPHGLITIMTTNNKDALDEAVIRPGRVDQIEGFSLLDDPRLTKLFKIVYGRDPLVSLDSQSRSPADLMETFKRNLDSPEKVETLLKRED